MVNTARLSPPEHRDVPEPTLSLSPTCTAPTPQTTAWVGASLIACRSATFLSSRLLPGRPRANWLWLRPTTTPTEREHAAVRHEPPKPRFPSLGRPLWWAAGRSLAIETARRTPKDLAGQLPVGVAGWLQHAQVGRSPRIEPPDPHRDLQTTGPLIACRPRCEHDSDVLPRIHPCMLPSTAAQGDSKTCSRCDGRGGNATMESGKGKGERGLEHVGRPLAWTSIPHAPRCPETSKRGHQASLLRGTHLGALTISVPRAEIFCHHRTTPAQQTSWSSLACREPNLASGQCSDGAHATTQSFPGYTPVGCTLLIHAQASSLSHAES